LWQASKSGHTPQSACGAQLKKESIMNNSLDRSVDKHGLIWSSLYAAATLAMCSFLNYHEPYSSDPVTTPTFSQLILWGSLYLPIVILPIAAGWKVTDFGFTLNPFLALVAILFVASCTYIFQTSLVTWQSALWETFARTGEEAFFRGFLFVLIREFFRNKRRPWLWAAILSSLLFALVHTQTFQPGYFAQNGSPDLPVGYQIVERLVNVFGLAFIFALLRVWTHSILPGAIAHSLSKAGIAALPFVLLIYGAAILWAHQRTEAVILRADGLGRLV
jgi:membrane protease YdiL (CAAX protease family)